MILSVPEVYIIPPFCSSSLPILNPLSFCFSFLHFSPQVSSYHPGMTGVQVTCAPQTASQHIQARPSYKRTGDTKKGKKKRLMLLNFNACFTELSCMFVTTVRSVQYCHNLSRDVLGLPSLPDTADINTYPV